MKKTQIILEAYESMYESITDKELDKYEKVLSNAVDSGQITTKGILFRDNEEETKMVLRTIQSIKTYNNSKELKAVIKWIKDADEMHFRYTGRTGEGWDGILSYFNAEGVLEDTEFENVDEE